MNKHKHLLEHREIDKISITSQGGLLIKFEDETHTYIHPEATKTILLKYNELMPFFDEEE